MANNQEGIQRIGVETVVQSLNNFQRDMNTYIKQLDTGSKATTDFAKTTEKTGKSGGSFLDFFKGFGGVIKNFTGELSKSVPQVGALNAGIMSLTNPATAAAAAVTGLGTAIFTLGLRGAQIEGVRVAFENTLNSMASFVDSGSDVNDFLETLKTSAAGTISEFELMRLTNVALAGSTGELRETFAGALPRLLEIARVQAAATGQSVDYLFQSLVTGLKRGSPLLIDNTGLVLSVGDANKAYAESLGITVEQMTEQQKQIALINATLEAGSLAIDAAGGIQENAATKFARTQATLQNITDTLAVSFEPTLSRVLDVVNNVLANVESGIAAIAPFIEEGLNRIMNYFSGIAQFIAPAVQVIMDYINFLVEYWSAAIPAFLKGAVNIAAAIGNGLLAGANHFIFPAVIQIATFIADFLSGMSPPPKGPLSTIDKGASNVMEAWMQGFVGGFSITPIEQITSEVNTALGSIGSLSAKQVEDRLKRLDLALRPFQERVKLLEDSFNALKEFTDAGLSAIDAEVNRLLPALTAGDAQAEERIRQLNVQRQQIEGITFAREQQLNQAKIDLVMARARQQQERTLLEIQQGRVGKYKEEAKAVAKVATETAKATGGKTPAKGTGTGTPTPAATPVLPTTTGKNGELVDKVANPFAGLDQFTSELGEDFLAGLGAGGELDAFNANIGDLDTQLGRIADSNPVQGILGAFDNLGTGLQDIVQDAVGWFTDPSKDGLAGFINRINTEGATAVFGDVVGSITAWLTTAFVDPFANVVDLALSVFRSPEDPNSLASYFMNFQDNIAEQWGNPAEILTMWIDENLITPFVDKFTVLTGGTDVEGSIASFMMNLPTRIIEAVGNTGDLVTTLFSGFQNWVMGTTEDGGLPGLINRLLTPFRSIPIGIWNALRNIGTIAWQVLVVPFISAVNEIIQRINEFFNVVNTSGLVEFARNTLNLQIPNISFNEISTAPPAWLQPPPMPAVGGAGGATGGGSVSNFARGGLATSGSAEVGEKGREMIMSAEPFAVFSNQFARAMETFSNAVMGGGFSQMAIPASAGIGTQNIDNSININANTQAGYSSAEMANRISMARVFGR